MRRIVRVFTLVLLLTLYTPAQFARSDSSREREIQRLQREVEPLYRKPTGKELKAVEPGDLLRSQYSAFLKKPESGITKLIVDRGCANNTKVISATENCLTFSMPGAGSTFSFRTRTYRLERLGDITYTNRSFQSLGVLQLGILVNLGDLPIENVTLKTRGMAFLNDFVPASRYEDLQLTEAKLTRGISKDGFSYRRGFFIADNSTYALRSIAFDGKIPRTIDGIAYNELDFDRRRDITVVLRVVDKDTDGNLTILWRILAEKKSPELKKKPEE